MSHLHSPRRFSPKGRKIPVSLEFGTQGFSCMAPQLSAAYSQNSVGIVAAMLRRLGLAEDGLIQTPAARQVVAVEAHASQHAAGYVAAQTGAAVDVNRFGLIQLTGTGTQLVHRNMDKAFDILTVLPLQIGADIQQGHTAVSGQLCHIVPEEVLHTAQPGCSR